MKREGFEVLEARLRRLEHRLALETGALVLVLVLAVLLGVMQSPAASQPQVMRTQAVEIVDRAGRTRLTLDAVGGKPSAWLFDATGRRRLGLTVGSFGDPEVSLRDGQGRVRIALSVGQDRPAQIRLEDTKGRPRVGIWITEQDEPGVWLFDDLARPRIGLKVLAGGEPRVWLFEHPTGRVLFTLP